MKKVLMAVVCAAFLGSAGAAFAEDAAAKPDCTEKQKASDDAKEAVKTATATKPDLTSCADKKGKEKSECEKPLKEAAKASVKDAKDKAKEAKTALDCCKSPKKKSCAPAAAAPTP